jgi:Flp pilus assembly protein TadB
VFVPELLSTEQFLLASGAALLVVWLPLWLIMPMLLALLLSPIALVIVIWLVLKFAEQRYVSNLDSALASTVARMSALLANGSGFQPVLRRIVDDLPAGPLRQEWSFIVERLGMPVGEGGLATPQMVVNALRFQTPSHRHSALLEHLSVALGQTHDILVARMQAAAQSLHDADRRRSAAVTELAQMRYSGFAVGLAGMFMAVYLFTSQQERFWTAYKGTLGMIAGTIVLSALVAPLIGGVLLSRSDDLDY